MRDFVTTAANLLIAVDYALLGWFFLGRFGSSRRLPSGHRWAVLGWAALVLFFFGCVHTHLDIAFERDALGHSATWPYAISHAAQAVGGLAFWLLLRYKLVVNIYDRETYEKATDLDTERRLDYLAARVGLTKR